MMSWWTKNRKYLGLLAAAAAAASGVGAPAVAGLLGTGAAGAGAAGAGGAAGAAGGAAAGMTAAEALAAAQAAGTVGAMGPVANGVAYGGMLNGMSPGVATAMGMGDKALGGLSKASRVMGAAQGLLSSPQAAPPPPPPPMRQQQPLPTAPLFGDQQMAPPGIDPQDWAQMTPEQKRAFMAQRGNI